MTNAMQGGRSSSEAAISVSVLVAAYKSDGYLKEALNDAVTQTFSDFEVLVFDDAASLQTEELVESFHDSRLIYRANLQRLGAAGNHRELFTAARGEFVTILNHDDRWDSRFLEKLIVPLRADPSLTLAFCDHRVIDEHGGDRPSSAASMSKTYKRDRLPPGRQPDISPLFIDQTIPTSVGCIFRRAAIDPMDLRDLSGPSYDLWLAYLCAKLPGGAYFVPESLVAWREHQASITSQGAIEWATGSVDCWNRTYLDPHFASFRADVRKKLAMALRNRAVMYMRMGMNSVAKADALRSLGLRWWDPKTVVALILIQFRMLFSPIGRRESHASY